MSLISKIAYSKSSIIHFIYLYLFVDSRYNDSTFSIFYFITSSTCYRFPLYNALSGSCIKSSAVSIYLYTRRYGQGGCSGSGLCGRGSKANSSCRSRIGRWRRIARCQRSRRGRSSREGCCSSRGGGREGGSRRGSSCSSGGGRCSGRKRRCSRSWSSGVDGGESSSG